MRNDVFRPLPVSLARTLTLTAGVTALVLAPGQTLAGPNAGGTLIVSLCEGICYTDTDQSDYCGVSSITRCEDGIVHAEQDETFLWSIYAAFPDGSAPRLAGVSLGVDYDSESTIVLGWDMCGDFQLTDQDWPAPGSGTAVTFIDAREDHLTELYWFAGYNYSFYAQDTSFDLIPHPSQGANFASDDVPSILDPVAELGSMGWGAVDGYLPCPTPLATGACCIGGDCIVLSEPECALQNGMYLADGVPCDPNPCVVPVVSKSWGQVKGTYR